MNAVVMMFLGAGVGMGLLLLGQALRPTSQPIDEVFEAVTATGRGYTEHEIRGRSSLRSAFVSIGSLMAVG
jgi:hypothetical protein